MENYSEDREKFVIRRTCKNCQNIDELEITEREAAFEEIRSQKELNWNTPCKKCNSTSCTSLSYPFVNYYKKEIFEEWKYNEKLHFYCQDEDIILADIDNLDNILEGIDNEKTLFCKKSILLETLCVLLYDNTFYSDEFNMDEEADRKLNAEILRPELIKRKDKIEKLGIDLGYISDYIKEVVFPQIGINKLKT